MTLNFYNHTCSTFSPAICPSHAQPTNTFSTLVDYNKCPLPTPRMFRIIDRRLRSASSKLENSAEMVLAKAQQQSAAVRSLSLRSRSKSSNRSREQKGTEEEEEEREGGGTSRTLLGLLSPRNWTTTATGEEGRGGAGSGTDPKVGEEQQPQEGREVGEPIL